MNFSRIPRASRPRLRKCTLYFADVLEDRRHNPRADVLSRVVHGGIDNTSKLIATSLWRLAWDIELRQRLTRDRKIIPTALA
jgi:cytochrome P450